MDLHGKTALVTGSGHRVGRTLALALARDGADIAVHYHTAEDDARETAAAIEALGRRAVVVGADIADPAAASRLPDDAAQALGRLDILVNSASIFEGGSFLDVSADDWDRVMAVNLRGPFLVLQSAARHLEATKGVAINIADVSGLRPWVGYPHHGVAKAGLIHLTRVAARSLAPRVRVNCIVPGTVLPPEDYTEEQVQASIDRTVLKRLGSPDDVIEALRFLVRSEFATGSIVVVDGGRMLR